MENVENEEKEIKNGKKGEKLTMKERDCTDILKQRNKDVVNVTYGDNELRAYNNERVVKIE